MRYNRSRSMSMRRISSLLRALLPLLLAACIPAAAQLSPVQPDPLARIREAAQGNTQACSATGETLCEQVAPKIIANAQGDSPLAENLRRLVDLTEQAGGRTNETATMQSVEAWALAAFHNGGVDAHIEKYANPKGDAAEQENVVAEIPGREKPVEWVLVGAHLDSWAHPPGTVDDNCDAAMVIEAARDILQTGIRPRRSIRFVLFTGRLPGSPASWAYVRAHRADLDRVRAAIVLSSRCSQVTGFQLNGRNEIEPGVREAMKPIESLGANHYDFAPTLLAEGLDFLLEGVPAITPCHLPTNYLVDIPKSSVTLDKVDIADLKRNTAIAAVTAFGIAERAEPIGPRQSRAEIGNLLKTTGLDHQMKTVGLWPLWESGERGRMP